ncbi:MAG: RDD family protein [Acidimicrobiales bacterium]
MSDATPPGDHPQPWDHHEPWEPHASVAPDVAVPPPPPLVAPGGRDAFGANDHAGQRGPVTVYAGFWRRFWARAVTGFAVGIVLAIANAAIRFATNFVYSATATCDSLSSGGHFCQGSDAVRVGGAVVALAVDLGVVYHMWSRSLAVKHGTVGMKQMGLAIRNGRDFTDVSKQRAFRRTLIWALPVVAADVTSLAILFDASRSAIVIGSLVTGGLVLLTIAGALVMVFDDRRRTLWDRLTDTVVVVEREPSWLSLLALLIGTLVPYAFLLGLLLAPGNSYRDRIDGLSGDVAITSLLAWFAPLIVVVVGAITFGHLGLHETKWNTRRPAGRGLALGGTVLGYSVPVLLVLGLVVTFTFGRVESLNERACKTVRRDITKAAEAFRSLNGEYPDRLSVLADTAYLGEAPDSDNWDYELAPGTAAGYRLVGLKKCAKA